jgi:hypothetical protein
MDNNATIQAYMQAAGENLAAGNITSAVYRAIMQAVDPEQYARVLETMIRCS